MRLLTLFIFMIFANHAKAELVCYQTQVCNLVKELLIDQKIVKTALLPKGADPHHYELKGKEIKDLIKATYLIAPNLHLSPWLKKIENQRNAKQTYFLKERQMDGFSKESLAHFWLDPEHLCQTAKELEKVLQNWKLETKTFQCKSFGAKKSKTNVYIITHDALGPLLKKEGHLYYAIRTSGHGHVVGPKEMKKLTLFLNQHPKVTWLIETNIDLPTVIKKMYRKGDKKITINTSGEVGQPPYQVLDHLFAIFH